MNERINLIATSWTLIMQSRGEPGPEVQAAQRELLDRYGFAIRRYLLGALRDEDAADELFQEFACKFLKGRLNNANPESGRFRDYLKTTLSRMVVDHFRKAKRAEMRVLDDVAEPGDFALREVEFVESWRESLIERAWDVLKEHESTSKQPFFRVLDLRRKYPELAGLDLVPLAGEALGKPVTYGNLRQLIRRARILFSDLLVAEVQASIGDRSPDAVEAELAELGLLHHCGGALERLRNKA